MALTIGTSGCTVGPDYIAPRTTLAALHSAAAVEARAAPPPGRLDVWWEGFDDPELTRIERQVLAQNLDLAAAIGRVRQSRAIAAAAGAALLPTVDMGASGSAMRQSLYSPIGKVARTLPGYNRDQRLYDVGAAASWEIDLFGGLRRGEEAARAEAAAAEAARDGTRISIAADAADAYLQVRGNQARLEVAEHQIAVDAHLLALVRLRNAQGVDTAREVAEAEALLQQAQQTVPLLRIALEAQLNRIDVLMAVQPGTYAAELSSASVIPETPAIADADRPLDMLRRRPDVIAAERRLAASNARIGEALSDYYPKISLSGLLGFDSLNANRLFTAAAFQPAVTGAIRWRLFDFGKVDAEIVQARGANAEALAQYRQTVLHAAEDVENAFTDLVQSETRTGQIRGEVVSLTRARDLSQQSYAAGVIPLTDVLDANRQLLAAQDQLALNRADAGRAAVRSYRALGGGWPA